MYRNCGYSMLFLIICIQKSIEILVKIGDENINILYRLLKCYPEVTVKKTYEKISQNNGCYL